MPSCWLAEESIDCIVFSGGGIRGLSHLGALYAIEQEWRKIGRSIYRDIRATVGTSIGAWMALMLAIRMPFAQWEKEMMDPILFNVMAMEMKMSNVIDKLGIVDNEIMGEQIKRQLRMMSIDPEVTFADLKRLTGVSLTTVTTCVNTDSVEYHNADITPNYVVWKSVVASGCIPMLLSPMRIKGRLYVDGGILDNVPIGTVWPTQKTICLRLTNPQTSIDDITFVPFLFRGSIAISIASREHDCLARVPHEYKHHIVNINTKGIQTWEFNADMETKKRLLRFGMEKIENIFHPEKVTRNIIELFLSHQIPSTSLRTGPSLPETTPEMVATTEHDEKDASRRLSGAS